MFEWFLGDQLIKATYSRLLTLGTALGVACVIVVFSLFSNYYRAVEDALTGVNPHIMLSKSAFESQDWQAVQSLLEQHGGQVVAARPSIQLAVKAVVSQVETFRVLCTTSEPETGCYDLMAAAANPEQAAPSREAMGYRLRKTKAAGLLLRGVVVEQGKAVTDLARRMDYRVSDDDLERLNPQEGSPMGCLVERGFIHGLSKFDDLLLQLPGDGPEGRRLFRLVSTLNLGMRRGERALFVTSLENLQHILGRPDFFNAVDIRLQDPTQARSLAAWLGSKLSERGIRATSWVELDEGAFQLLDVLRTVIFIIVFSVVAVAGLSVISTLSLMVKENRRKIAILRAMGVRDFSIHLMFWLKSFKIAVVALAGGTLAGWIGSYGLLASGGIREALRKLGIVEPEVYLGAANLTLLALATAVLYFLVALIPAREACRVDPVEGLRS